MDWNIFGPLLDQLLKNPAALVLILPVSIAAAVMERLKWFPNTLILPVCILFGSVLYPCLVKQGTVSPDYPFPLLVLFLYGFVLGFVAWVAHIAIVARLMKKLTGSPVSEPSTDKTEPPKTP